MCGNARNNTICGLIGVAGDCSGTKKKIFEELLAVDVVRGHHSTGAGLVNRFKREMSVTKTVGPPNELFCLVDYQKMIKESAKVFIGHNRYATMGKVVDENAHPFLFANTMGAHNGTLEYQCRHKLFEADKFGTDSEAIFSHINKYGFAETVKFIHNPTYNNNAWALTWYDLATDSINMARNEKRPLYYGYSEDMCSIFWASDGDMLKWILKRNSFKLAEDKLYVLLPEFHYKWDIPDSISKKFGHPTMSKIITPEKIETTWSFSGTNYHYPDHSAYTPTKSNIVNFFTGKQKERLEIDTKTWKPPYKDFNGSVIGKARLMDKIVDGCTFCSPSKAAKFKENFQWGDFLMFCRPDVDGHPIFLCEDCYNDPEIKSLCKELI